MSEEIEGLGDEVSAFVREVIASRQVWGLEHPDGWALTPADDDEELLVMPFWSTEAGARRAASDEWSDYTVAMIPLEAFVDSWLPGMGDDGFLVGPDWDEDLVGPEVEPEELELQLRKALAKLH